MKLFMIVLSVLLISSNASASLITLNFSESNVFSERVSLEFDSDTGKTYSSYSAFTRISVSDIFGEGVVPLSGDVQLTWMSYMITSSDLFSDDPQGLYSRVSFFGSGNVPIEAVEEFSGQYIYSLPWDHFFGRRGSYTFDAVELFENFDFFESVAYFDFTGQNSGTAHIYMVTSLSTVFTGTVAQVPEPMTLGLFGLGLLAMWRIRRV